MPTREIPVARNNPNILIVDDDPRLCKLLKYNIEKWGYTVDACADARGMRQALARHAYAVVLLDIRLPDANGVELLPELLEACPVTKTIMISAHGTVEMAMDAVRMGAFDFLTKPVDLDRCRVSVRNACQLAASENESELLRAVVSGRDRLGSMIGASAAMQVVYEIIGNVAMSDCSVLISGETGTGKELVAAEIHRLSSRHKRDLITVNCAAIPAELIESEMFGHMKGSFTGAAQDKIGAAERADRSTLFLDEIAELRTELQAKFLRFLQDKQVTRVGGTATRQVDVRIVAATNHDPEEAVAAGKLRRDLLYRLNVIHINMPPLRERRADIPLLAEAFLTAAAAANGKDFTSIDGKARRVLMDADWLGNVRQLKNVMTETVLMHKGTAVTADMLPASVRESALRGERYAAAPAQSAARMRVRPFWETEKAALQQALYSCRGNVTEAAAKLEISRPTLYRKIKHFNLDCASD
jgi:two-component system, repressor protein LuxO